jgi:integrase
MSSDLSLKVIHRSDGVLHPILVHRGIPLILPNMWIDDLSLTSRFNTLKAYLHDVLQLYQWAQQTGVSLHESFASLRGLSPSALKSAAVFMTTRRDGDRASQSTCARKAQALRSFFSFSFDYFLAKKPLGLLEQRQSERNREALLAKVDKLFVMRSRHGESTTHSAGLSAPQLAALEKVFDPASEVNPFPSYTLRVRNYCIWRTLLATGARRAEIVLLELDDLDLGERPTITIRRPTLASMNRRRDGASLKTEQRTLPIREGLAGLLETYVEDWRVHQIRPRRPSPALFLSAKDGRRLSCTTINQILKRAAMSAASVGLSQRVHPHCLRTTAMNTLSRRARDKAGRLDPSFRDSLTYFAGWSPGSEMPLTYTREALSEALGMLLRAPGKF